MRASPEFPRMLQAFFTDRLMRQRQASPHTIASYRDTFRLLLKFAQKHLKREASAVAITDLDTAFIGTFLDHLEKERGICARSRNVRLAAIHSFFRYIAIQEPTYSALAQRVLAMPSKRWDRRPIQFLTRAEVDALLAAPNLDTWGGRRDRTLFLLAVQTGLRVSELIGLRGEDVVLGSGAHVQCQGKGRKERCTPLRKEATAALRLWLQERGDHSSEPLFPSARGRPLSRDGVEYLLSKQVTVAQRRCPSLKKKRITPHMLRHTLAMELLQAGVDRSVIALWLGHESIETTQIYLHADLAMKEQALARMVPLNVRQGRYRPCDSLMVFLKSL